MSSSDLPQVAVIGLGYWGPNLARNFRELGALSSVCDRDAQRLQAWGEANPGVSLTTDWQSLLDSNIEGLVIATPAFTHYELAKEALSRGKHVFVEKPLALRSTEAEDLSQLADQLHLALQVGHILAYHPAFEALAAHVRAGHLGTIHHVRSERMSLGKLRHEEDVLWSFAPHDLSLLQALIAEDPSTISSSSQAILQPSIADRASVQLTYPSGATAQINVSWLEPVKRHCLTVIGSRQMAVFDDTLAAGKVKIYDSGFDQINGVWTMRKGDPMELPYETGEPMKRECQHFLDCIKSGDRPRTDGHSATRILRILEAASRG